MTVLDTNVVSALMHSTPDPVVVSWLDAQPSQSVWITSICVFEILYGLNILPGGKRRKALQQAFEQVLTREFEGRVLDFDTIAAHEAAIIAARLKASGRPIEMRDVQIAGIVVARRGTLATRNTKHFLDTGIAWVNPFEFTGGA